MQYIISKKIFKDTKPSDINFAEYAGPNHKYQKKPKTNKNKISKEGTYWYSKKI